MRAILLGLVLTGAVCGAMASFADAQIRQRPQIAAPHLPQAGPQAATPPSTGTVTPTCEPQTTQSACEAIAFCRWTPNPYAGSINPLTHQPVPAGSCAKIEVPAIPHPHL